MLTPLTAFALVFGTIAVAGFNGIAPLSFPANTRFANSTKGNWGDSTTIRTWPDQRDNASMVSRVFPAYFGSKTLVNGKEVTDEAVWADSGVLAPNLCGQILVIPRTVTPNYNGTSGMPFGAYIDQLLAFPGQPLQSTTWEMNFDSNTGRFYDDVDNHAVAVNIIFADMDGKYYQTGNLTYSPNC